MAQSRLGKDAILVPIGTTAERPSSPEAGEIRFNTDENEFEGYDGTQWDSIVRGATTPIGGYVFVQSNLTGAEAPDSETHILLTAGEDGVGEYNQGKLTNESVSGSAPLVVATAEIADAESPMNGQTVQLVNTENRYLMPGTSPGAVAFDQMQQITGRASAQGLTRQFTDIGDGRTDGVFNFSESPFNNANPRHSGARSVGELNFNSADSPDARTGDHTSPKNIEVTVYMRIL